MEMLYGGASGNKRSKRGTRRTIEFTPIMSRIPENIESDGGIEESLKTPDNAESRRDSTNIFTGEQEKELESLLKEFLTS